MKYKCTNSDCGCFLSDSFSFAPKGKHSTQVLPLLVLKELKNINTTVTEVAERLNVSDTTVYNLFEQTVDLKRLPLSSVISIDEVYLNTDSKHKYALIIFDFITGEPIDIVESRREADTEPYFNAIPKTERDNVKYLVCDMYNPYISYTKRYFTNAVTVIDCFHVISWINDRRRTYYNSVKRKYQKINNEKLKENNLLTNRDYRTLKDSKELYILKHFDRFLTTKKANLHYSAELTKDYFLDRYLDDYQREKLILSLDDKFEIHRDLTEKYYLFDEQAKQHPGKAAVLLDKLIAEYEGCNEEMFVEFSKVIRKHRKYILNSYTFVEVKLTNGKTEKRRLSNGPIEQFNANPKTLKRISRGIKNFNFARNRILWAMRSSDIIPLRSADSYVKRTGKPRGKYKKK